MSCICQYIASLQKDIEMENVIDGEKVEEKTSTDEVSGSESTNLRIENWLLKKKLNEAEIIIANLESMVTTVATKQHQSLCDINKLQCKYNNLQTECLLQRDYHAMERNTLIFELRDANQLIKMSREAIKQTVKTHEMLMNELDLIKRENSDMSDYYCSEKSKHESSSDSEKSSLLSSRSSSTSLSAYR